MLEPSPPLPLVPAWQPVDLGGIRTGVVVTFVAVVVVVVVAGILTPPRHCDSVSRVDENTLEVFHRSRPGLGRVLLEAGFDSRIVAVVFVVVAFVEQVRFQLRPTFLLLLLQLRLQDLTRFPVPAEVGMGQGPSRLGERVRLARVSGRREEESGPALAEDLGQVHRRDQPRVFRTGSASVHLQQNTVVNKTTSVRAATVALRCK